MKKRVSLIASFVLMASAALPSAIFAKEVDSQAGKLYAPGQVVVKYKANASANAVKSARAKANGTVMEKNNKLGFEVVKVKGSVEATIEKLKKDPNVEYAEPNYYLHASYTPNDPYFSSRQYGPQKIQAPQAWDIAEGSGAKIAIVDTGVQSNHPDLAGKVVGGWDFVDNDSTPQDGNGHGTHCAGIAAAVTNNSTGIAGTAPKASILAVRVLDNSGSGTWTAVANGITYAADQGAKVISLSLGGTVGNSGLQQAVDYAWSKGSVVVAAAGNAGNTAPNYPAYYSNAIAVASTDQNDNKSSFSTYGSWVDVAAPGSSIYSTYPTSTYASLSGTSMATPHVAGVAGLLASQGRSAANIRAAIENTADKISGTGTYWAKGRVNAYKAVQY
ncbi:peptidase S8 [Laceyella sacchari]|uniref:Thermitase Serine peptidase. MEROPS family S08A n=2 Tax=Laceyella TaxID=292635 RepID=A0AA46ADF8_9BACL|nr:S8 family peptidase [Laceyella tengchongensis]AUS08283.1 peptidase S8 [Laceyella sacchari]PRZ15999.1 thermitase [Laceyella sediminis]SMP04945.1 thermitase Serine peptidase. MEROPS family S08A [Laceyella tengchongensis]